MAATLKVVTAMTSSRSDRLNLNDGATFSLQARDIELSPPQIRRSVVETLLRDGAEVPASAYANRTLTFELHISAASSDALATQLQNLNRELDRERNYIEYKPDGATNPVFFRTFRSAGYDRALARVPSAKRAFIKVSILCEPFAYGLRETALSAGDVNNDPDVTNGMFRDITGVLGEVPTPAQIVVEDSSAVSLLLTIALRARGTPGNVTFVRQAEAMTVGTDTTTQPNDAAMSGIGNNFVRITFAGDNTLTPARLTRSSFLGPAQIDLRGTFRLLARVRRNGGASTDDFEVRAQLGRTGSTVAVTNLTGPQIVDLGLFTVGEPSTFDGYGAELVVASPTFIFNARRTAGTGDLDVDYVLAIPADAAWCQVDFGSDIGASDDGVLDGPQDAVYRLDSSGNWAEGGYPWVGGILELVPNQTNRIYVIRSRSTTDDVVTDDINLTVRYWPRYMLERPA